MLTHYNLDIFVDAIEMGHNLYHNGKNWMNLELANTERFPVLVLFC